MKHQSKSIAIESGRQEMHPPVLYATFIFSFIMFWSFVSNGQDTLYAKAKAPIPVIVVEISETHIKYKSFSNPDGPTYVISKKNAEKIIYRNGSVDLLTETKPPVIIQPGKKKPYPWFEGHSIFSVVVSDLIFSVGTINFERTFLADRLGIRIPFSVGFNASGDDINYIDNNNSFFLTGSELQPYYNKNKIYSTGVDVLIYPFIPGKINYFAGPSFGLGRINYWTQLYSYTQNDPYTYKKDVLDYYSLMVKNGVSFIPIKNFAISLNLAMGVYLISMKYYDGVNNYGYYGGNEMSRAIEGNICFGYRF